MGRETLIGRVTEALFGTEEPPPEMSEETPAPPSAPNTRNPGDPGWAERKHERRHFKATFLDHPDRREGQPRRATDIASGFGTVSASSRS